MAIRFLQANRQNLIQVCKNGMNHISTTSTCRCSTPTDSTKVEGWDSAKPYTSIPGPKPLPIIGNAWLFLPFVGSYYKIPFSTITNILYKQYGKIFRLGSIPGRQDMVFVSNPEDIEMLFRNEGIYPFRDIAGKTIGHYRTTIRQDVFQGIVGMLADNGKSWHDVRSKVNPILMQPQNMYQYIEGIDSITNELLTKIRHFAKLNPNNEMPDDFMNTIYSWALENAAYIAIDKKLGCLDLKLENNSEPLQIIKNVIETFALFETLQFQPSLFNIYKTKKWKRFVEIADFLVFTFLKYIKEAELKLKNSQDHLSVLQQLLRVDRKVAITTSMDTLFGGIDTTGKQVTSILYYLAKNQNAQDSLREELITLLADKNTPITKNTLAQASYLKAVIKEGERIAPIAGLNLRHTIKDMVFSGYQIPKGTSVVTCNEIASKLSENYPRPLEFLPERWLRTTTSELSHKNTNPFVTLPFGFGPRSCVGKRIANLEMKLGIAKIIRNFRVMWHYKDATFGGAPFVGVMDPLKFQFNEIEN